MEGWIKLHRRSLEHWLYKENRPHTKREAWEDLLLHCNHSDEKILIGNELIECKRGQSIKSLLTWSKTFNWTISKVRRFFILLEKDSMIQTENVKKTTRITICKYEDYQGERNNNETKVKRKRNEGETQATTNKNVKNVKKDISDFDIIFDCFIEMRNKIKKPLTDKAKELIKSKLSKLTNTEKEKILILEQSIENSWQGVFPLNKNVIIDNNRSKNAFI